MSDTYTVEPVEGDPFEKKHQGVMVEPVEGDPFAPAKPKIPQAYMDRLADGAKIADFYTKVTKAMGKGAAEGFGNEPLGITPEHERELFEKLGLNPAFASHPLYTGNNVRVGIQALDLLMRTTNATIRSVADGVGEGLGESGLASQGMAERAKRDLNSLGQVAMIVAGALPAPAGGAFVKRHTRGPRGEIVEETVGGLPKPESFQETAAVATRMEVAPQVEPKLKKLWEEKGVHPAEVLADAERDPVVKQALLSSDPTALPEIYGLTHTDVRPDWDNWDRQARSAISTRRLENGDVIPAPGEIASYLDQFGREAGFKFQVGPARQWGTVPEYPTPFENQPAPMFQRVEFEYPGGYKKVQAHVYIPDEPDYQLRSYYGLGKSEILFHEVGHALDVFVINNGSGGKSTTKVISDPALRAELVEANKRFAPQLWEMNPEYRSKPSELMADGIAAWLSNPEIRKDMPLFTAKYGKLLEKYKEIAERALPKKVDGEWKMPPGEEPRASAGGGGGGDIFDNNGGRGGPPAEPGWFEFPGPPEKPTDLAAAQDRILGRISVDEGTPKRGYSFSRLYTDYVDKFFPLAKEVKDAVVKPDVVANDPYKLARLFAGWAGKADHMIERGTFDFYTYKNTGPGLRTILEPVKNDVAGFRAYIASIRILELHHRGIEHGFDVLDAAAIAKAGKPEFKAAAKQIIEYQNHVAGYLRDSGVLNDVAYAQMLEANRLYVPFHRVMGEKDFVARLGNSLQARNPIKKIVGSDKTIVDPIESIIKNTYLLTQMAEKNVVDVKLIDMLLEGRATTAREGRPAEMTKLPAVIEGNEARTMMGHNGGLKWEALADTLQAQLRGEGADEIAIYRNGQREVYRVDLDLAQAMKGLDAATVGTIERLLKPFTTSLRAGAVLNPEFQIRHTLRDFVYAFVTTAKGVFTPLDHAKGFAGLIIKDADYWNWMKGGGGQVSMVALDRSLLQEKLYNLTDRTGMFTRSWNTVIDPNATWLQKAGGVLGLGAAPISKLVIHPLQVMTEFALSATHLAAYKKAARRLGAPAEGGSTGFTPEGRGAANLPATLDMGGLPATQDYVLAPGMSLKDAIRTDSLGKQQIIEAAWISRETSIDGQRIGAKMAAYNMVSAFANAKVQDTDTIIRVMKDRPISGTLKLMVGISLPSAALWFVNKDDSRYKELPMWEKYIFWHIITDKWEPATAAQAAVRPNDQVRISNGQITVNNGYIFRVPKPFGAGVVYGSGVEQLLEHYYAKNPEAFKGFGHALLESTVGDIAPNALAPVFDQAMNRSAFSGRTLIPANLEKQLPEYQYTPYTTETAKALGKVISAFPGIKELRTDDSSVGLGGVARAVTSPILMESYVRGWFGALGQYALRTADLGLRQAGIVPEPIHAPGTLADVPVVRAFVSRYPSASGHSITEFYEGYSVDKKYLDTWQAKSKEGDLVAMQRISALGGQQIFAKLEGFHKALGEHTQIIKMIDQNPQIKDYEKRQLIDSLYFSAIKIGQEGNKLLHTLKDKLGKSTP